MKSGFQMACRVALAMLLCVGAVDTAVAGDKSKKGGDAAAVDVKGWSRIPVLNDRLDVSVPPDAGSRSTNHDLMEADSSDDESQRIFIDVDGTKVAMLAEELYLRTDSSMGKIGTTFAEQLSKQLHTEKLAVTPLAPLQTSPGKFAVTTLTPASALKISDAFLLKVAVAKQADSTVQRLSFFVNDPAVANIKQVKAVIDKVIASIAPGARQLRTGPGVKLGKGELTLDLPANITAAEQFGTDFSVYRLIHLLDLGDMPATLGIYLGHAPRPPSAPGDARSKTLQVFGQKLEWHEWDDPQGIIQGEGFMSRPGGPSEEVVHVFAMAANAAAMDELLKVLQSARLRGQK